MTKLYCFRGEISLFAYVALLLLPLSFFLGVGASSLSLAGFMFKAVRRGSLFFSLFVIASAACVYETGLLLVCACRTFAAPVELLPWGWRARRRFPSVSVASGSKLLAVAHCSLFIVASTLPLVFWLHWR